MVKYKDVPDYYFKKALALEKLGKYEEAIECYDKILGIDPRALNAYHNKGVALEKLGRHEEAEKCFAKVKKVEAKRKEAEEKWLAAEQERLEAKRKEAKKKAKVEAKKKAKEAKKKAKEAKKKVEAKRKEVKKKAKEAKKKVEAKRKEVKKKAKVEAKKKAEAMQKTKDVKIKKRWFEEVWSRIIKNEGKLMKTKRGVVFSYRTTKYKKSIMPQLRLQNSGPKFPVYSEGRYITNTLVERALDIVPVVGPTELKILLEMQSLDTSHRHLWGILHDERISKGDW